MMVTANQMRVRSVARKAPHMAAGGGLMSDADLGIGDAAPAVMTDSDLGIANPKQQFKGIAGGLKEGVVNAPSEGWDLLKQRASDVYSNLNPFDEERRKNIAEGNTLENLKKTGKGLLGAIGLPFAFPEGAIRSAIGTPMAEAEHTVGTVIAPETAAKDDRAKMLEASKEDVATALSAAAPRKFAPTGARPQAALPAPPQAPELGVALSEGQRTGELPLIRREQAALKGQMGPQAEEAAKAFFDQQRGDVLLAREEVAKQLDPFSMRVAESPREAGELVSKGVQQAAAQRKASVDAAYDLAKRFPGAVRDTAFEGIDAKIRDELYSAPKPVILDDRSTPFANLALNDLPKAIEAAKARRAPPTGANSVEGLSLTELDQIRKRISTFREDAWGSGNRSDGRAASAVVDAFDAQIDNAIANGLFTGDKKAIQAWWDARAAHQDYRKTFYAGKNDPIGRTVERILGKGDNPAAIPNDVADFMYGSSGVNPSSLNVGVAKRIRGILGDQSPEWSGVKQGLFSRLTEAGEGVTEFGPAKTAQRINRFLNNDGKELAEILYSPQERALIQKYADLQRSLEVPPGGTNRSETSTFVVPVLNAINGKIGLVVGAALGHLALPGIPIIGEAVGAGATAVAGRVGSRVQARGVARQFNQVQIATKQWEKAVAQANRQNSPQSEASLRLATANLARSLSAIGIDPASVGLTGQRNTGNGQ